MAREARFDAARLDINAFAAAAGQLEGEAPQSDFARLQDSLMQTPGDMAPPAVRWTATGALRSLPGGATQPWLQLDARSQATLQCQRCLQPVTVGLDIDRWFRFVGDEAEAARLDEASEEDVLVASSRLNLLELLEDELILALPLVPMHEVCTQPLPMPAPDLEASADEPHPFAALTALRRPGGKA